MLHVIITKQDIIDEQLEIQMEEHEHKPIQLNKR